MRISEVVIITLRKDTLEIQMHNRHYLQQHLCWGSKDDQWASVPTPLPPLLCHLYSAALLNIEQLLTLLQ